MVKTHELAKGNKTSRIGACGPRFFCWHLALPSFIALCPLMFSASGQPWPKINVFQLPCMSLDSRHVSLFSFPVCSLTICDNYCDPGAIATHKMAANALCAKYQRDTQNSRQRVAESN